MSHVQDNNKILIHFSRVRVFLENPYPGTTSLRNPFPIACTGVRVLQGTTSLLLDKMNHGPDFLSK